MPINNKSRKFATMRDSSISSKKRRIISLCFTLICSKPSKQPNLVWISMNQQTLEENLNFKYRIKAVTLFLLVVPMSAKEIRSLSKTFPWLRPMIKINQNHQRTTHRILQLFVYMKIILKWSNNLKESRKIRVKLHLKLQQITSLCLIRK